MWLMLQQERPDDYVVATGETHTVQKLVETAFAAVDLDWRAVRKAGPALHAAGRGGPAGGRSRASAKGELGWEPLVGFDELVRMMVDADLERLRGAGRPALAAAG